MNVFSIPKIYGIVFLLFAGLNIAMGQSVDTVCFNSAPNPFISNAPASGGDNVYTYLWQDSTATGTWQAAPGTNNTLVYQPVALTQTTYFRRQVNSASCGTANSNVLTVMVLAELDSTSSSITDALCNGGNDGAITINVTGGLAPYTYVWSAGGSTTNTNSGLSAGTYTVSVTDSRACDTKVYSFTVNEPAALVASSIVDSSVTCSGFLDGGATASASGGTMPYTYMWSNTASTASITGVAAGTYTVTITDANGCSAMSSVMITESATLVASSIVDSNVTCNGFLDGGATASASGGTMPYTYMWSNTASTASITGVAAGTYTVTITDANGCTNASSAVINEPAALVASSIVDSSITCNGFLDGGATASASGGTTPYTYMWSNTASTASITGVAANTYTVTITDANGCTNASSVVINEPTMLSASINLDNAISCYQQMDGGITAMGSGGTTGYSFLWNTGDMTASLTNLDTGSYTVTVTDANGCTTTASAGLTQPDSINVVLTPTNVNCNAGMDGAISSMVTGGMPNYSYLWSSGPTTSGIMNLSAGTYTVTVTDSNGCMQSASTTVTEPMPLNGGSISTN